jgi:predicted dehydrogenase
VADRVKVGVIGTGTIGVLRHLPAYRECVAAGKAEIVAVCDPVEESVRRAAEQFEVSRVFANYEELLALSELDAVSVCTPNVSHEPITLAALGTGKHVLCEKPLAMSYAGARRMAEAAQRADVKTGVNFRYRWIPAATFVHDLIRGGELGEIYHVFFSYFNGGLVDPSTPIRWRELRAQAGSGALGDLASHLIDLTRYWLGEITAVTGQLRTFTVDRPLLGGGTGRVDVDDATSFFATLDNGADAVFSASRCALGRNNHQRAEIYGTKGAVIYEIEKWDRGGDEVQLCLGAAQGRYDGFTRLKVPPEYLTGTPNRAIISFVDAILGKDEPRPDFDDGLRCQEVLEAVERSAREGSRVSLPLET